MTALNSFYMVLNTAVPTEYVLEKNQWYGAPSSVIIAVISVLISLLLFLTINYFRKCSTQKHAQKLHPDDHIEQYVEQAGLTGAEVEKLKAILHYENVSQPQAIFHSIVLFERCIERQIQVFLAKQPTDEQQQKENDMLNSLRCKLGFDHLAPEHPLASSRNIALGQTGALYGHNHKKPLIQHAEVVGSNEFSFLLQYNVDKEDVCYLQPADEVKYAFSRLGDNEYGIPLRVMAADGAGLIELCHTIDMRRFQFRQFVRIETSLPLKFRLINTVDSNKSEVRRGEVTEGKMTDISGGGLSFICEKTLRAGDRISLGFNLPNKKFTDISARILRISLQEGKSRMFYRHHAQFVSIDPRRRDLIVKYVFDRQRQINQWR